MTESQTLRLAVASQTFILEVQMETLQKLVKHACELYGTDTLAPSIVTSWVTNKSVWYVSVVRWRGPRNELQRQVLFGVTDANLEACYTEALRRLT